ncbi:acyltransferase family protein [Flavobacterium sp. ZT3R17]|uniref:acyltransferase family protein n=1 Tax=Flavobacterium cryoconiti TaxID=3398736 RepID=UPI003A896A43
MKTALNKEINIVEKYDWVDALRGYAILLVILIHSSQTFYVDSFIKKIADSGYLGVQLFFIMSSFTLFKSYNNRLNYNSANIIRNFFIRRVFRIAPYYYSAGLIYVFYKIILKGNSVSFINLLANFTFTNGIYLPAINDIPRGGWSVGIEMLFYFTLPLLIKICNSLKKTFVVFIITLLFSIFINQYQISVIASYINAFWNDLDASVFYYWLPNQLPIFILGIILYYIHKEIQFNIFIGYLFLTSSMCFYFLFCFWKPDIVTNWFKLNSEYIVSIIFVFFTIGIYSTKNKLVLNKIILKFGQISFSLYLNHFLVINFISYLFNGFLKFLNIYLVLPKKLINNNFVFMIMFVLVLFLSYLVSQFTYKAIELKGQRAGEYLIKRLNNKVNI